MGTVAFARDYLGISDPTLLQGRMSDHVIDTIEEVKRKHRSGK